VLIFIYAQFQLQHEYSSTALVKDQLSVDDFEPALERRDYC